jgi:hypothetical protein
LNILSDQTVFIGNSAANETYAKFIQDGSVELYYNNSKKFETTNTGVSITGDFTVDTDTLFVDSTNSQVGINNASPSGFTGQYSKDLIIGDGTGDRGITIYSSSLAYGSLFFKDAEGSSTANGGFIAYNHFVDGMEFGIGNAGLGAGSLSIGSSSIFMRKKLIVDATYSSTDTLTVDPSNARVGIFNDSPSYRLDVAGDARFTGQTIISSDLTVDTDTLFVDASEDSVGINTANPSSYSKHELVVTAPDDGGVTIASATDEAAFLDFSDGSGLKNFIRVDHDGDIFGYNSWGSHFFSIGEGVPSLTLTSAAATVHENLIVEGNVGIGIDSPVVKLEIQDSTHTTMKIRSGNNDNILFAQAIQSSDARIGTDTNTDLSFYSNASERMRIDSNGSVSFAGSSTLSNTAASIQHYSPNGYLYIYGGTGGIVIGDDSTTSRMQIQDNSDIWFETAGAERMRITSAGALAIRSAIGTTSSRPAVGTAKIAGEIAGVDNAGFTSDGGFLRLSAGGGTDAAIKSFIDLSGYSTDANLDRSILLGTGGTERMRIDSSGNVNIVGDGNRLKISSADYDLIKMGAFGDSGADIDNGFLNLSLDGSEKIRLLANGTSYFNGGNVGISTTSPDLTGFGYTTLTVVGGTTAGYAGVLELGSPTTNANGQNLGIIAFMDGSTRNAQIDVTRASSTSTSNMHFYTNGGSGIEERMRITSGGDIQVTGGSFYNSVSGITIIGNSDEFEFVDSLASGTKRFRPGVDNSFDLGDSSRRWDDVWATNPAIQTSDRNEKNTIKETDLGLDFINKLKPVSYIWNNKTRTHYGLIAQDVQEVLKDISKDTKDFAGFIKADVSEEKDNTKHSYGLRYNEFISPMIKAIQEQQEIINDLKSRIEILENK